MIVPNFHSLSLCFLLFLSVSFSVIFSFPLEDQLTSNPARETISIHSTHNRWEIEKREIEREEGEVEKRNGEERRGRDQERRKRI